MQQTDVIESLKEDVMVKEELIRNMKHQMEDKEATINSFKVA
jgi:hypothetical protein